MSNKSSNTRTAVMDALFELASETPEISVVCADSLKSMRAGKFAKKYPERIFDVGIGEQNAVDFGAGLAASGLKPFVATYAGFLTMRACEQIRTYVAYPELNVVFVGANGGISGGEREGVTHQFFEDVGITRTIPGMTVVVPADGHEVYQATKALTKIDGPAYLRVGNDKERFIFDNKNIEFELGKIREMEDYGDDVTIFASGPILYRALKAASQLNEEGINVKVIEVHTLKPLDEENIIKALKETKAAITVEDHNIIGGLGSAISKVSSENYPVPIVRIGLQDVFPESGDGDELLDKYKMGINDIKDGVKKAINLKENLG